VNLSESGKLVAFVATVRPDAARAFYEGVLGLKLLGDGPVALEFDAHGTILRVVKIETLTPAPFTVAGWVVDDIVIAVDALASAGVTFERFEDLPQDEQGICVFAEGSKVAWFRDPDGNLLSLSQEG
jgi:catechol 2,3-dioxygenase-like lactoylglutathione lyase family enzyme